MKLYSIASGSSGNSIFVGSGRTGRGVLIDAGISRKRMEDGLALEHISFDQIDGIFITHEHSDHISGLGPVLRKYNIPVYATEGTMDYILGRGKCGRVEEELFQCVRPDVPVAVGGMEIMPFSISHDAAEPVCYTIRDGGSKVAVATDMGEYTDYTFSHLLQFNAFPVTIQKNSRLKRNVRMSFFSFFPNPPAIFSPGFSKKT